MTRNTRTACRHGQFSYGCTDMGGDESGNEQADESETGRMDCGVPAIATCVGETEKGVENANILSERGRVGDRHRFTSPRLLYPRPPPP